MKVTAVVSHEDGSSYLVRLSTAMASDFEQIHNRIAERYCSVLGDPEDWSLDAVIIGQPEIRPNERGHCVILEIP